MIFRKNYFSKKFLFLFKFSKFKFSLKESNNSNEFEEIKKSLDKDKETFFSKVKNIFISKGNNQENKKIDVNSVLKDEKTNINNLFSYIKSNINNLPSEIDKFPKISLLINKIKFIHIIREHKKYDIFISDILFILNRCREPKEIIEVMKIIHLLKIPKFWEFWEKSNEKLKYMMKLMEFNEMIEVLILVSKEYSNSNQ